MVLAYLTPTLGAPKYADVYVHDGYNWLNGLPEKAIWTGLQIITRSEHFHKNVIDFYKNGTGQNHKTTLKGETGCV